MLDKFNLFLWESDKGEIVYLIDWKLSRRF